MASPVDQSKEDQIKDLLEEIDLHKFIRDDLLSAMGECEEATEVAQTLRSKEIQLAELLGDPIPAFQAARTPPILSPTPQTLTSTPTPAPSSHPHPHPRMPSGAFNGIPGDSFSTPHWPSAAPSPFAAASQAPVMLPDPPKLPQDDSRKRPLSTSEYSPTLQGSSKRNALSQPETRKSKIEEIDTRQAEELAAHHRQYETLIRAAVDSSEEDDIRTERDDVEKDILSEFQLERDAELARALQYEENCSQLPMSHPRPRSDASWYIPDRTQPMVKPEPGLNSFRDPRPYSGILPLSESDEFGSDDGFEEITADSFNSRLGKQPAYTMPDGPRVQYKFPSEFSKPQYLPGPSGYSPYPGISYSSPVNASRSLPWMQKPPPYGPHTPGPVLGGMPGPIPGAYPGGIPRGMPGGLYDQFDQAFDLVRNQQEIFDDELDIAYVCFIASSACFQF
jgi:hypothetical protein